MSKSACGAAGSGIPASLRNQQLVPSVNRGNGMSLLKGSEDVTTLDMAMVLEVEERIGPQVATVMKNGGGSMYLADVAERIMDGLPSRTKDAAYADPWITEQVQESIYRKVYKWVKGCKDVGRFIEGGHPVTHPTFGCIPDGHSKYLWFRVSEAGDQELRAYEDWLRKKAARPLLLAEGIKAIRQRLGGGRLVREIIRYD